MKVSYKKLRFFAAAYAAIPIVFFYIGWLIPIAAIIFSLLTATAFFFFLRSSDDGEYSVVNISGRGIAIAAVIALVWCFIGGQGGFLHQTTDHNMRNAIFRDMIRFPWPVIYDGDQILSYYIAQWIVPALFGKAVLSMTGSVNAAFMAGRIALLIWSSVGIFIALLLVSLITASNQKARIILSSLMLIFFSGLDIIGSLFYRNTTSFFHLEWWAGNNFAQFSSFTTCLFWVYNQFIVSLIITLCIVNEKSPVNFAFLGVLIFPYGPFPFIGIVMICIIKAIVFLAGNFRGKALFGGLKNIFSFQNIISIFAVMLPYALYYMSNAIISNDVNNGNGENVNVGFRFHGVLAGYISEGKISDAALFGVKYLLFMILEVGIYFAIIMIYHKKIQKKDITFILSSATLLFIPLFQVGLGFDFAMRVSMPAIIYIGVEFMRYMNSEIPEKGFFKNFRNLMKTNPLLICAVVVFCIGAFTAEREIERPFAETVFYGAGSEAEYDSMNDVRFKSNFVAQNYELSLFYKFLMKK